MTVPVTPVNTPGVRVGAVSGDEDADTDPYVPHLLDVEVLAALRRRMRLGQTDLALATAAVTDVADLAALRWDQ